jgi:hypothetical protein
MLLPEIALTRYVPFVKEETSIKFKGFNSVKTKFPVIE